MSLIDLLKQAQGGDGLSQLASQFGLDESKATELSEMLAPSIGNAAKEQAQSGGLNDLLDAFKGENQGALYDDAAQAASPAGQAQGMEFLEKLMGGQNAEGLASDAASQTGVDMSTIMQFLPALAGMLQGGMQKQTSDSSLDGLMGQLGGGEAGGGLMGMVGGLMGGDKSGGGFDLGSISKMLDADGDGNPLNDVLGKFLK